MEKKTQRFCFVMNCLIASNGNTVDEGILYLETRHGNLTKLLAEYFPLSQLHACNRDEDELFFLREKFVGIQTHHGDILKVAETSYWLGVWYDMEETWCKRNEGWNWDKVPKCFNNTIVCAVTLTNCRSGYTAEQHAIDLSKLLSDKGGDLKQQPYSYVGKGGVMNMIFAIATFKRSITPKVGQKVSVKWLDGIYSGCILSLNNDYAEIKYEDGKKMYEHVNVLRFE